MDFLLGIMGLLLWFGIGYLIIKFLVWLADNHGPYRDEWEKKLEHRENCCCCKRKGPSDIGDFTSSKMTFYD